MRFVHRVLTWGSEEVGAWVATNSEVSCGVHAHEVVRKGVKSSLKIAPESLDIRAVQKLDHHFVVGPLAGCPGRDVTLQATGVVSETEIGVSEVGDGVGRCAGEIGEDRTDVDWPVLERSRGHAPSSSTMGDLDQGSIVGRDAVESLVGAAQSAVTAQGGSRTIESGGLRRVIGPARPVVVGLLTFVSTFVAKGLLVGPGEPTVPGEEVASVVDAESLLDVCCDKVVVPVLATRTFCLGGLWGQLGHALYSGNVAVLLSSGESSPETVSIDY